MALHCHANDCPTQMKHILCEHHWTKLRRIHFKRINTAQKDFAIFCVRHASTLKHLGLSNIRLVGQGSWASNSENIRKTLTLNNTELRKPLSCDDPPQLWLPGNFIWDDDGKVRGSVTEKALFACMVHGGSCLLLAGRSHPSLTL